MNSALQNLLNLLQILASSIADSTSGKISTDAEAAEYFLRIAKASLAAYQDHAGQPVDPALLHPEAPIA